MLDPEGLDEDLRDLVKPELAPDERILWASRGRSTPERRGPGVGILWAAGFWMICAAGYVLSRRPEFTDVRGLLSAVFVIFGLIAFLTTIGVLSGVQSRRAMLRRLEHSVYVLTDRRAILWRPQPATNGIEVHQFSAGAIVNMHRVEYPDRSGDIWFQGPYDGECGPTAVGFEGVSDVRDVEALIRRTLIET